MFATVAPARLAAISAPVSRASLADFHVHPHYREQRPIDALLLKVDASLDDAFPEERRYDRIARVLTSWADELRRSPQSVNAISQSFSADFRGTPPQPSSVTLRGRAPAFETYDVQFTRQEVSSQPFLTSLQAELHAFSSLLTTEFQVTRLSRRGAGLQARVRGELVGTGASFHREQRIGTWEMEWDEAFRLRTWRFLEETRSRSMAPMYEDITQSAIGSNPSYSAQLARGVDDWRMVMDGASGIDIYGHNGVSVGDIDGNGFDDLYVCQPAGLPNRLYRNRGDGTFVDITEGSGVGLLDNTACALFADFDNDGRQDLVVVRASGPLLFLNTGGGKFRLREDAFHFATPPQGTFTGAAAADYDRDGWLDIYFCLYVFYQGTDQYKYPTPYFDAENGPPNFLMRNNRNSTFGDVTAQAGLEQNNTRYSFCCGWNDYDGNGWPDLCVVNDFGRKNLYRNNADGTFTDVAAPAGSEDVGAGMSVCAFDYDNDGAEDLYIANMWTAAGERISNADTFQTDSSPETRALYRKHAMGNSLLHNQGSSRFEDRTQVAGVGLGGWAWSSDMWDFDHNGNADLYVTNGMVSGALSEDLNSFFWRQVVAQSPSTARYSAPYEQGWNAINELIREDHSWSGYERNRFYVNNGDGAFSDISGLTGLDFLEDGRAFALTDFNRDGRQEIILKNRNGPQLRLLQNVMQRLPPAIAIRLQGTKSNRDAIGAAITLTTELGLQTRMLQAGSGFLSQHSKEIFFGLGESRGPFQLSVRWPSGLMQHIHNIKPNQRILIEEGREQVHAEPFASPQIVPPTKIRTAASFPTSTWLLEPVAAPALALADVEGRLWTLPELHGRRILLIFGSDQASNGLQRLGTAASGGLQILAVNTGAATPRGSEDVIATYNILYRMLFDRHRDLPLPTSFLLNEQGDIVKVYQGAPFADQLQQDLRQMPRTREERIMRALPFVGISKTYEFGRNYLSFGSVYFQRGYFEQAAASFELALRDDPSSAEAHYGIGSAQLRLQRPTEAKASFERALKLKASYPDTLPNAWNNLGLLAIREKRTDEAITDFKQALQLNADHVIALQNLGNAYRQAKRWNEAQQTFQRALAVAPNDPEANYGLAMVFAQRDDAEQAYKYLQLALQYRPVYPEALNNLGVLYLRTRRRDEAVAKFEECIRVAPTFDQSYLNLARLYAVEGSRDKAREVLRSLLREHPDHALAQQMLEQLK